MRLIATILLLVLSIAGMITAQEATEEPEDGPITGTAWLMTDADAEASAEDEAHYVLFLSIDEGATLIEVAAGADVLYTRGEDDLFAGAPLIPTEAYEFASTLEMIEEDVWQSASTTTTGSFTFEQNTLFTRTDLEFGVWVEGARDLIEYSMFAECLGRVGVEPPGAFANPDPILPIRLDDEAGTLTIGDTALPGGGGIYELVEEGEFGQFAQVTTQTATVSEDSIAFTYQAIAGERDDCEVRYETTFVPFDGDYETLFSRAEDLGEEE